MRERIYAVEALILQRTALGEADRLLLLATPEGKQRVVAKGCRKTTSRLAGHLELFTQAHLLLARGRQLAIVTQSQVGQSFPTLRASLARLSYAYYVAELYTRAASEADQNLPLFTTLLQTFAALDAYQNLDLVLHTYELQLLNAIGYRPQLHQCVVCQTPLTEAANRFSPQLGGVLCPQDDMADPQALPMSLTAFKVLRLLQTQPLAQSIRYRLSTPTQKEVARLLQTTLSLILEHDFESSPFLISLRQAPFSQE
jgi:DNA repair protein RecO (recombination protein O)